MIYIWFLYDSYMIYIWFIYDLYMIFIWFLYGLYMIYIWFIYDLYMIYIDLYMIYIDLYMIYIWFMHDLYMIYKYLKLIFLIASHFRNNILVISFPQESYLFFELFPITTFNFYKLLIIMQNPSRIIVIWYIFYKNIYYKLHIF